MLYSDAALFRIRRWFENLDRRPGFLRSIAEQTGFSPETIRRAMVEGYSPNLETVRRLERLVPPDFMPLRFSGVMTETALDPEPETATVP